MANPDKHLMRNSLVAVKPEVEEGTAETLVAADYAILIKDMKPTTNIAKYVRQFTNLGSRGTLKPVIGSRTGGISGGFELVPSGGAIVTAEPPWAPIVKGLGYVKKTIGTISIGAITGGPFQDGEIITGGTSSATGIVLKATADGVSVLLHVNTSGAFTSGEVLTGSTSGATTTTSSTASDYGLLWMPDNDDESVSVGANFLYDTANKKATGFVFKGCRGNLEFGLGDVDEPALCQFTLEGAIHSYGDITVPTTEPAFADVAPAACMGVALSILGLSSVYRNFSLNLNADLAFRKDLNLAAGVYSRYIKNWKPGGRITPELVKQATFDFYDKITGQTEGTVGFVFDGGGIGEYVELYCPTVTIEDFQLEEIDEMMMAGCDFGAHEGVLTGRNRFAMLITK